MSVNKLQQGMFRRYGFAIWSKACYHRQYRFVDGVLAPNANFRSQCECYYEDMNASLPQDKQLDSSIELPKQVPLYQKHLLVISPQDRNPERLEWKTAWQSRLELNNQWPYSVISKLKEHLKDSQSGSGILVNAVAMVSGDIKPLETNSDRIAHIFVLPDSKLYAIHERQIEDFAHFIGGGRVNQSVDHKPSFNDYLRGADNVQILPEAGSLRGSDPHEDLFDYKTSRKDWILVCGHYQRDQRCGLIGQDLIKVIEDRGLGRNKNVGLISHIGGHKYAGNVILYNSYPSKDKLGKYLLNCLWFGKVVPPNVLLLFEHLENGMIPKELYRGGMSMD
ncbi:hypothetical protein HG536_0G04420 [Torulaspora globosa]|uniref:Altered inheritance of mitochondria protein 32 n=1 Tax=Torulaspora globosa TaxID=48254 RepID=A0A7G3ZM44_9SACH|nr:uncharacterized protein HG536_0G04420 [Torulaspora globosa]QLL34580.1 hypothetical protein HG536_0G04420 [Torulaspora globosa]